MPLQLIPVALGALGLYMLAKSKSSTQATEPTVDLTKLPKTPEGNALQLYAYAMQPSMTDPNLLDQYSNQILELNIRPDLADAIAQKARSIRGGAAALPNTPEGQAIGIYANAMQSSDVGYMNNAALDIQKLGVRPDLVDAIMQRKASLLAGVGR